MRKAFYVWRLNPIEENLCSNPFEFLTNKGSSAILLVTTTYSKSSYSADSHSAVLAIVRFGFIE